MRSILVFAGALSAAALTTLACTTTTSSTTTDPAEGGTTAPGDGSGGQCTSPGSVNVAASVPGGGGVDGGEEGDAGVEPTGCPVEVPVSSADIDADIGWKCPSVTKGACTADEIATIEANLEDQSIASFFDLGRGVSDTCKACFTSKDSDAAWNLLVGTAADNGSTGFFNFGACFGFLEGGDCGRAVQYEQFCYSLGCLECATDATSRDACLASAGEGMCKNFAEATIAACPGLADSAPKCAQVADAIRTMCL